MTTEELERRAYADGNTWAATLLGKLIDTQEALDEALDALGVEDEDEDEDDIA